MNFKKKEKHIPGEYIELHALIIHGINKNATETKKTQAIKSQKLNQITDIEKSFIDDLHAAYFSNYCPIRGVFDESNNLFSNNLSQYLAKKIDFLTFSHTCVDLYKKIIDVIPPATGGILVFAHYTNTQSSNSYFIVLTLNNKSGFNINNFKIEKISQIDLRKIDVACMINITQWKKYTKNDPNTKTFLSFAKGNKEISNYFMEFIGYDYNITEKDSTKNLIRTLSAFYKSKNISDDTMRELNNKIYHHTNECIKNNTDVTLKGISAIIYPDYPEEFITFASQEDYMVGDVIKIHKSTLRSICQFKYKRPDNKLSFTFDYDLLNKKEVVIDNNQIIFMNIPEDIINEIKNEGKNTEIIKKPQNS